MNDQMGSCVATAIRVEQMRMIRNLIEVKVPEGELNSANFTDGLKIEVKSEKPFIVSAYWIVKIVDLHREIEKDWRTLLTQLTDESFLSDGVETGGRKKSSPAQRPAALFRSKKQVYHEIQQLVQCEIRPPCEIDTSSMTQTPRDFYPLVIIVTCYDEDPNPIGSDAAANIHIIHIKDSIVPIKSHVIKQYIKQIDGRILDISQLYQEESAACFICFEEADPVEGLKLFCLLPCRHSPICSNCILRIRECPKCRCPIASVFDINSPGAETMSVAAASESRGPTIDPSLRHLYDDHEGNVRRASRRQEQKSGFLSSLKSMFGI